MSRKILVVFLAAVLTASSAIAQLGVAGNEGNTMHRFGVTAGLNRAKYWGSDAPDSKMKSGIRIGVVAEATETKGRLRNFSLHTGLLFSQQGGIVENYYGVDRTEMTLNYLYIPINTRYKFDLGSNMGFFLQAGFYTGYAISGRQKTEYRGETKSTKINFGDRNMERFDMGLGLGAGLQVLSNIEIGLGYNWSFFPLVKAENASRWVHFYNAGLALTATYFIRYH
jgi:opacity protein-like surface antigen